MSVLEMKPESTSLLQNSPTKKKSKDCYYYYVYRKRIDPDKFRGPEDIPIPIRFREMMRSRKLSISDSEISEDKRKFLDVDRNSDVDGLKENNIQPLSSSSKLEKSIAGENARTAATARDLRNDKRVQTAAQRFRSRNKDMSTHQRSSSLPGRPTTSVSSSIEFISAGVPAFEKGSAKSADPSAFFKMTSRDGLKWSRHTVTKTHAKGQKEEKVDVQAEKFFKGGKWIEEVTQKTTTTDARGKKRTSTKKVEKQLGEETAPHLSKKQNAPSKVEKITTGGVKNTLKKEENNKVEARKRSSKTADSFSQEILEAVNKYRKKHNVKPLVASPKLIQLAKEWAEKLAQTEKIKHSDSKEYGENIFLRTSTQPYFVITGQEVVDEWYKEEKMHDYNNEPKAGVLKSGHFSQLIWENTSEMGSAQGMSKSGHMLFVVSYFHPKGNWIGEFKNNVPPVGGFSKTARSIHSRPKLEHPLSTSGRTITNTDLAQNTFRSKVSVPSTVNSQRPKTGLSPASSNFIQEVLESHNFYRKKHQVKPLVINEPLNRYAQSWADHLASVNTMAHREDGPYGENIYMKWSPNPNYVMGGDEPVSDWYSEIDHYNFDSEDNDLDTGHLSQLLWRSSVRLGVGISRSEEGKIFVTANYDPPGNYVGQFVANVPPPT